MRWRRSVTSLLFPVRRLGRHMCLVQCIDDSLARGGKTPIKITLIHNPAAGDDSHPSGDRIVEMIQSAGHKVKYHSIKEKDWKKVLKKSCDIIAIAGGDGTVGKVARRLVGSTIPIAILPMGTANNIGHALGLTGRAIESLITEWETARRLNFDMGEAEGPWGSKYFVEGVGVGLFAATILSIERTKRSSTCGCGLP